MLQVKPRKLLGPSNQGGGRGIYNDNNDDGDGDEYGEINTQTSFLSTIVHIGIHLLRLRIGAVQFISCLARQPVRSRNLLTYPRHRVSALLAHSLLDSLLAPVPVPVLKHFTSLHLHLHLHLLA
jgi:hypothetical protein